MNELPCLWLHWESPGVHGGSGLSQAAHASFLAVSSSSSLGIQWPIQMAHVMPPMCSGSTLASLKKSSLPRKPLKGFKED